MTECYLNRYACHGQCLLRYKSMISFYPEWCFWCQRTKLHYAICGFLTLPNRWYFLVRVYHWVGAWQYWLRLLVHKMFERPSVMVGQPLPPISPWFANSKVFLFPKWTDVKVSSPRYPNFFHFNIIKNLQHNILYGIVQRFCFETHIVLHGDIVQISFWNGFSKCKLYASIANVKCFLCVYHSYLYVHNM